jgi:hypothetical protein
MALAWFGGQYVVTLREHVQRGSVDKREQGSAIRRESFNASLDTRNPAILS